ncbi:MAG: cbb3-type cytochrome c oxidase subunit I, partial [Gaiellaceae bacterium]
MSETVAGFHEHETQAEHPPPAAPPRGWRRLTAPGWLRVPWVTALFFGIGAGLAVLVRWLEGWHPIWDGSVITTIELVTVPIGFLVGLGGFDYWMRYASGAPTVAEDHSGHGARSWRDYFRVNTDHKVIGIQYLVTTIVFFVIAGLLAMFMRAELAQPGMQFVDNQAFNSLFSVHAALMIFLFVIPAFAGIGNYVIPLMLGAPDMAFPRLNALSFWLLPIAGLMMVSSFLVPGGAFAAGWTNYAPLSVHQPLGNTFFAMGVQWAGASSIMTALNFLVTIITMRAPGMTFWRMPLLVWANFTTSLLVVIATPFIAGSQFFVLLDRALHTDFFNAQAGGHVIMYQHVFWFYSHPAVYIMMLPGFGIMSEVISTHARKPVFGYRMMAFSLLAIVFLGFTVWAHHMFVSGMSAWLRVPMMITTMLIAVPTGIKIFSWLATLYRGVIHLRTPMLFALGFLTMFTLGGISGVMLAVIPYDIHVSDTYFIVAHIHYVLFGGSVFTIFAGIYHWFPKMTGRMYDEKLGQIHFWMSFVFFNTTFGPMHFVGIDGMPRRVADYAQQYAGWNLFISISAFIFGASF